MLWTGLAHTLSTPCNGFLVVDHRFLPEVVVSDKGLELLSTPCNGFEQLAKCIVEEVNSFQLHVMDSFVSEVGIRGALGQSFQLHVMDSQGQVPRFR